jgi:hypothetical protein
MGLAMMIRLLVLALAIFTTRSGCFPAFLPRDRYVVIVVIVLLQNPGLNLLLTGCGRTHFVVIVVPQTMEIIVFSV